MNSQPAKISTWKRDFLNGAEEVFESGKKDKGSDSDKEKDRLLRAFGQLKIENDFLKDALR